LLLWTAANLKTPKGDNLDFIDHSFLVDVYEDPARDQRIKKAAQIGVTTYAINKALWFADSHDVSIIYTFPTARDVLDFSRARINPIIQISPYMSSVVKKVDSVALKQIKKSFIYFRGAWSERQAITVDSDFNIHDEVDFSKPDIIDMYQERMSHSKFKWFLALSTPTIPMYGIDYLYNQSDKKEWFVVCKSCNKPQILKYPDSIDGDLVSARYKCVHCGATIDDNQKRNGYWEKTGDVRWGASGYHITQLMVPWITAREILIKKDRAETRPTAQLSGIRDFYNFVLGEAYGGENQPLNRDLLLSCIQNNYDMEKTGSYTVMGVDQGNKLHVVVFKVEEGRTRLLHAAVYDSFGDLPNIMDRYEVVFCVIDALPNKHSARTFMNQYLGRVYLAYYNVNQKELIKWYRDEKSKEYRVVADKIETLDKMSQRFVDHRVVLPRLSPILDQYIRQLCNWAKDRVEKSDGRVVFEYKKIGEEHFTMATNYAMMAVEKVSTGFLAEPKKGYIPKKDRPITSGIMDEEF